MRKSTHFTNLGVSSQPSCADALGYIKYRHNVVERLKAGEAVSTATRGERWIAEQEARIETWREQ